MNIGVILAGGIGSRLGDPTPKQFFKVAGKTVIEHTVDVFESHPQIDEIAIVMNAQYIERMEDLILRNRWTKVKHVLKGGDERYKSSLAAIEAYRDWPDANLIFHDAVRPLVSHRIISDMVSALEKFNAVDVAVPSTDTIIQVDENTDIIQNIPIRKYLRRGQTPQAFKQKTISKAYEIALKDPNLISSDDCGTVVKYLPSESVFVVKGEESNMKLTYKEDLYLLDKLFQLRSSELHTAFSPSEIQGKVIAVFGGNSGIGKEIVRLGEVCGAKCFSFSRSTTGTDISDRASVRKALEGIFEIAGRIDFVVNCAAILVKEPLATMNGSVLDEMIATDYNGMVYVAAESHRFLRETRGQLLLFTSSSYTRGRAFYSIYSSTKAAAVNFMQALAQEWDADGIRVNVINPERTATPMRRRNFGIEPADSLLSADEVAKKALLVLSSDFTGQVIDVKIGENE